MGLELLSRRFYRLKKGQTLRDVAKAFSLPPQVLARENGFIEEPQAGAVLYIPERRGNLYTVKGGESISLLCGTKERFVSLNKTTALYPTQTILI